MVCASCRILGASKPPRPKSLAGSPFVVHPAAAPAAAATPASAAACFRKRRRPDPFASTVRLRDRVHCEAPFVRLSAQDDRFGSWLCEIAFGSHDAEPIGTSPHRRLRPRAAEGFSHVLITGFQP